MNNNGENIAISSIYNYKSFYNNWFFRLAQVSAGMVVNTKNICIQFVFFS